MGRKPVWIGTSWKMNKGLAATQEATEHLAAIAVPENVIPFIIPAFTSLETVAGRREKSSWRVGAQSMHWEEKGAGTGEVSPAMVCECGADIVELGHSERREFNAKHETLARQTKIAFHGLVGSDFRMVILAYEPVWAIGSEGIPATPAFVSSAHSRLRKTLKAIAGEGSAQRVPIRYGGSVSLDNAACHTALADVDDVFVDRSACDPNGLASIIRSAA